jgi:ankyrin repeat protein
MSISTLFFLVTGVVCTLIDYLLLARPMSADRRQRWLAVAVINGLLTALALLAFQFPDGGLANEETIMHLDDGSGWGILIVVGSVMVGGVSALAALLVRLLLGKVLFGATWRSLWRPWLRSSVAGGLVMSLLFVAAFFLLVRQGPMATSLVEAVIAGDGAATQTFFATATEAERTGALSEAAGQGHEAIVDYLLAQGLDPDGDPQIAYRPLYSALQRFSFYSPDEVAARRRIVDKLLAAGADPRLLDAPPDSALALAAIFGDAELVQTFLEQGVVVAAPRPGESTPVVHALVRNLTPYGSGLTAAETIAMLELVTAAGAPVTGANATMPGNFTPLQAAAWNGSLELVEWLLAHGATVDDGYDLNQQSPLMEAAANGHVEVVKLLLNLGADPALADAGGNRAVDKTDSADLKALLTVP